MIGPRRVMAGKIRYGWTYERAEEVGECGDVVDHGYYVEHGKIPWHEYGPFP